MRNLTQSGGLAWSICTFESRRTVKAVWCCKAKLSQPNAPPLENVARRSTRLARRWYLPKVRALRITGIGERRRQHKSEIRRPKKQKSELEPGKKMQKRKISTGTANGDDGLCKVKLGLAFSAQNGFIPSVCSLRTTKARAFTLLFGFRPSDSGLLSAFGLRVSAFHPPRASFRI
jgi:hypothetical protein